MPDELTYKFMYKCRYCGEVFSNAHTGPIIGNRILLSFITSESNKRVDTLPGDLLLHQMRDHVGIADFIGCKIE